MQPISWYLLVPVVLSGLYGCSEYRSMAVLEPTARRRGLGWLASVVAEGLLAIGWAAAGYPLPVYYLLVYLCRAGRLLGSRPIRMKSWFLLNLSFVNLMALHLVIIGVTALLRTVTMQALLAEPLWRTVSLSVVLAAGVAEDVLFLRWPGFSPLLSAEAGSAEARPFMAFLWFCTGYLLVDSLLCVAALEPFYPPLFLVGSSVVLMFFLIRFLLHINAIIQGEHYKDEHDRLEARLEAAQEDAGVLRQMVDRDALTGAYSRRYVMERMSALIGEGRAFSLAYMDLDGLKQLNDRLGHDAGDRYLAGFARALETCLREGDLLSRVGGDEFVVLLPGCGAGPAGRRMEDIRAALEQGAEEGYPFSYGVADYRRGTVKDAGELLRDADRAMYEDKQHRQ